MDNQQIYDDIDYSIMVDCTRRGNLGTTPAELARADMQAHEWLCDSIQDDYVCPLSINGE